MSEYDFLEEFISAIDPAEPDLINIESHLASIPEWDSLAVLGVIVMFETLFDRKITGEIIASAQTVRDIFNFI